MVHDEFDALRVKAIVGHYLLHPLYLSTYHIEHVLELNEYMKWVLKLLDVLILDPTPLLKGDAGPSRTSPRPSGGAGPADAGSTAGVGGVSR